MELRRDLKKKIVLNILSTFLIDGATVSRNRQQNVSASLKLGVAIF